MKRSKNAFTLIELLVVVAIIALLISILLPSLRCARESARAARCGVMLRSLGTGITTYSTESKDWLPGVNTSGATYAIGLRSAGANGANFLRSTRLAVQRWDWMSPSIGLETELGGNRAKRFRTLVNEYYCPSQAGATIDFLWGPGVAASPDGADFTAEGSDWRPLSYLMPAQFQYWGEPWRGKNIWTNPQTFTSVAYQVPATTWEYKLPTYRSRVQEVGDAARKFAATDGTRYLTDTLDLDFDVDPLANLFGSFADPGGWWGGSQAFGAQAGTLNWSNSPLGHSSSFPDAKGQAMALSYRHGCWERGPTFNVRQNKGQINALHFDGHVARYSDRESREVTYWYPKGTVILKPNEGMTSVPANFVVP